MNKSPAVELDEIESRRGRFTLGPLSLTVPRGSVVALIGPNGAGKTTALDLIMGFGAPQRGQIRVLGLAQPSDDVEIKRKTAYINPDLSFASWKKVGPALDFMRGFYPDWDDARCTRLLQEFNLSRSDAITALSFGARIKLLLIMALSRDAELLLLDEPTVGLDTEARYVLFREILEFMKREGRTVVISSHQLTDLERMADHVALLNKGRLLTSGRMDSLVERYSQVEVRFGTDKDMPALDGIRLLGRQDDRLRLLFDRDQAQHSDLTRAGMEILAEAPMTLEEVYLALTAE